MSENNDVPLPCLTARRKRVGACVAHGPPSFFSLEKKKYNINPLCRSRVGELYKASDACVRWQHAEEFSARLSEKLLETLERQPSVTADKQRQFKGPSLAPSFRRAAMEESAH